MKYIEVTVPDAFQDDWDSVIEKMESVGPTNPVSKDELYGALVNAKSGLKDLLVGAASNPLLFRSA